MMIMTRAMKRKREAQLTQMSLDDLDIYAFSEETKGELSNKRRRLNQSDILVIDKEKEKEKEKEEKQENDNSDSEEDINIITETPQIQKKRKKCSERTPPIQKKETKLTNPGKKKQRAKSLTESTIPLSNSKSNAIISSEQLITQLKSMEKSILEENCYDCIIGVDEAGRGPLAGPVVVAACYIPFDVRIEGINDSKVLTKKKRETIFEQLITHSKVLYEVTIIDNRSIDELNILQAALKGMRDSGTELVQKLQEKEKKQLKTMILVDGNRDPEYTLPNIQCRSIVKGDSKVYCIAAASIIAKVRRDRLMCDYHKTWPQYGFDRHKGYPSPAHKEAVWKYGPCAIHRRSFNPVKEYVQKYPQSAPYESVNV